MSQIKILITVLISNILLWLPFSAAAFQLGGDVVGGNFSLPVTNFSERKFQSIYRQDFDFSCGSAALASLLTDHYHDEVTEHEVFVNMYEHGDHEKIKREGFSLLDMKRYLQRRGYQSDGFQVKIEQLNVPAITIIDLGGYMHFIVIKGVSNDEVLVGDPSNGVKAIAREKFDQMWGGRILFMIYDYPDVAANTFHSDEEWSLRVKGPMQSVIDRGAIGRGDLLKRGDHDL